MYHRVADVATDPWELAVAPANFAVQVALLQRRRTVLPAAEFVARAERRALPRDAVALTFDDGYLDNLTEAAPLLADAGLPATLFLATGQSERGTAYWWDELAAMVLDAEPLEATVMLAGEDYPLQLGPREPADDARQGWRAWQPRTQRERLHYRLWEHIGPLTPQAAGEAMAALRQVFRSAPDPSTRAMTAAEVATLTKVAPFTIGGHTADHADLPAQRLSVALDQIVRGREAVAAITGHEPVGFAYPSGRHDRATRLLVEAAGFAWACTTEHGSLSRRHDRYRLPRIAAQDVPHIDWLG